MVRALIFFLMAIVASSAARAEKRIALVVGNSAYQHTATLRNPHNDASDVAVSLKRLGFEVLTGIDLDKRSMERSIRQFGQMLVGADVALFFYAGHGLQVFGQNYLLPTDARLSSEGDVDFESIPLLLILKQMEREAKASLLLLDACRDNPIARNLARTMGTRAATVGQGLAEVRTGVGTLISFSTQPGNVALDGSGRNSPYTAALIKHVEVPGRDISATLIHVRNEVVNATLGKQVPWEHTSLLGQVMLTKPGTAPAPPVSNSDKDLELAYWNAVKDAKSPDLLRAYVEQFPNGTFVGLARALIDMAEHDAQAHAKRGSPSTSSHGTESAKQPHLELEKPADPLAASKQSSARPGPSPDVDGGVLVRDVQRQLQRLGCEPGKDDGKWGPAARSALERFNRATKSALPVDGPTEETLAKLAATKSRACPLECRDGEREANGRCVAIAAPKEGASPPVTKSLRNRAVEQNNSSQSDACVQWKRCYFIETYLTKYKCGEAPRGCQ